MSSDDSSKEGDPPDGASDNTPLVGIRQHRTGDAHQGPHSQTLNTTTTEQDSPDGKQSDESHSLLSDLKEKANNFSVASATETWIGDRVDDLPEERSVQDTDIADDASAVDGDEFAELFKQEDEKKNGDSDSTTEDASPSDFEDHQLDADLDLDEFEQPDESTPASKDTGQTETDAKTEFDQQTDSLDSIAEDTVESEPDPKTLTLDDLKQTPTETSQEPHVETAESQDGTSPKSGIDLSQSDKTKETTVGTQSRSSKGPTIPRASSTKQETIYEDPELESSSRHTDIGSPKLTRTRLTDITSSIFAIVANVVRLAKLLYKLSMLTIYKLCLGFACFIIIGYLGGLLVIGFSPALGASAAFEATARPAQVIELSKMLIPGLLITLVPTIIAGVLSGEESFETPESRLNRM